MRAGRSAGATEWWCLGDLVGYGGDPGHCARVATSITTRCLAGNHDLAAAGRIPLERFADWAFDAVSWTFQEMGSVGRARLDYLLPSDPDHEVPIFHASPRDPIWEYIVTGHQALDALTRVDAPMVMVGHTHVPSAWVYEPEFDRIVSRKTGHGEALAVGGLRCLINPGSVGQPRDGDPRASWLLWDPDAATITFQRTPYDVAAAQNAILAAGLPPMLASRLSDGR